jgi:hypothetical protein
MERRALCSGRSASAVPTRHSGLGEQRSLTVRRSGPTQFPAADDWTVFADGRLVIVRVEDYPSESSRLAVDEFGGRQLTSRRSG